MATAAIVSSALLSSGLASAHEEGLVDGQKRLLPDQEHVSDMANKELCGAYESAVKNMDQPRLETIVSEIDNRGTHSEVCAKPIEPGKGL